MMAETAVESNDALSNSFTALQTSGGSMAWDTMLLLGVSVVVVAFLVWYFLFRSSSD